MEDLPYGNIFGGVHCWSVLGHIFTKIFGWPVRVYLCLWYYWVRNGQKDDVNHAFLRPVDTQGQACLNINRWSTVQTGAS